MGHSGSEVTWRVTRGLARGQTRRTSEFRSDSNLQTGRSDAGFLIHNDERYDVAQILVPAQCVEADQRFTDDGESTPPLLEPAFFLKAGASVAWAGFPSVAHDCFGTPTLCVYRGIVSATSTDPAVYLIDGNVAPGVSGGPVWAVSESVPSVLGVVSGYWPERNRPTPGLSHFIPLSELGEFIKGQAAIARTEGL